MIDELEQFLEEVREENWAGDDCAFEWIARRVWVGWWCGMERSSRVFVERAGPQMRAHP